MTDEEFYIYLQRYKQEQLSEEELKEWMLEVAQGDYDEAIKSDILDLLREMPVKKEQGDRLPEEEALHRLLEKIRQAPVQEAPVRRMRPSWTSVAAAAAIVLALGTSLFYLAHRPHRRTTGSRPALVQDIAPGTHKALLTLADGSQVVLDSARSGLLTRQGRTQVYNREGGLVYNAKEQAPSEPIYNTLQTTSGETYALTLADGSKLWLNAASSVRYPTVFTGTERRVEITGEAYFEVSHPAGGAPKPFIVSVYGMDVLVLGTHFNINAYGDEPLVKTTLLEGRVKVVRGKEAQMLLPGQQAVLNREGKIKLMPDADISEVIAWKEGRFEFNGNIEGIMRQVARWYNVEVEYRGDVSGKSFGGAISRYENVSKVLKMLELTGTIHFDIEESRSPLQAGKIIVRP